MGATADAVDGAGNGGMDSGTGGNPLEDRIVDALLGKGRLKEADLGRARRLQAETGGSLLALLGRLGLVSERDHAETVAAVLGLALVGPKDLPELPPEGVPLAVRFMKQFAVCPVAESDEAVDVLALGAAALAAAPIARPVRAPVRLVIGVLGLGVAAHAVAMIVAARELGEELRGRSLSRHGARRDLARLDGTRTGPLRHLKLSPVGCPCRWPGPPATDAPPPKPGCATRAHSG